MNIPFLPLFEGHFIGEASNRDWHVGRVGDVPDRPAGQNQDWEPLMFLTSLKGN